MTFLQPWMLWGLALALAPVLIHLMNRMRYRSRAWAAMAFLLAASRRSRRQAKLRHWLILLCRALGIAALLFALARPLTGGWLGWALQSAPDMVILLLDRSASMEGRAPASSLSKRELALERFSEAARNSGGATRYFLIDSATRSPREVTGLGNLAELATVGPTDTAADIPALLAAAVETILANRPGRTELWLASDLQRSNWAPDSPRWAEVTGQLAALPQAVTVRLLALSYPVEDNLAVQLVQVRRGDMAGQATLELALDLKRRATDPIAFPLTINLEGARTPFTVEMTSQQLRLQRQIPLGDRVEAGGGAVELPADTNPRDNQAFFVFDARRQWRAWVVGADAAASAVLRLAAAPAPELLNQAATRVSADELLTERLDEVALVIWQGDWPTGAAARRLDEFMTTGGVVIAFPAADAAVETAAEEQPFRVTIWDDRDGLLARTADGVGLRVNEVAVTRRVALPADGSRLASFSDEQPFLTRRRVGQGSLYACATLPVAGWSTLAESVALVPMLQRALHEGAQRLGSAQHAVAGDETLAVAGDQWERVDAPGRANGFIQAGIYRSGPRWLALNRPVAEDDPESLDEAAARPLFGAVTLRFFEEAAGETGQLQSEIWRLFLWAMLCFLFAEALLALPGRSVGPTATGFRGEVEPT